MTELVFPQGSGRTSLQNQFLRRVQRWFLLVLGVLVCPHGSPAAPRGDQLRMVVAAGVGL